MKYEAGYQSRVIPGDTSKLTAVDLFCGCGGVTVGLKKAGFKVLGAMDNDHLSVTTYRSNHPDVVVWEMDIRELTPKKVANELGLNKRGLDLLAGCPPCQGYSTLRTLNGSRNILDPRNDLLFDFLHYAETLLPRSIMLENVPGLANNEMFTEFCDNLKKLGYLGRYCILNAAEYGVPQRRRRLIYIAGLGAEIQFAKPAKKVRTVRDAIGMLPKAGESGDPVHDLTERRSERVMEMIQLVPKNGGSRSDLPEQYKLECHKHCNGFKDVYGRMAWDDVAPTITSGCFNPSKGRFLHPEEDRAITMREAALLQSFPRRYRFPFVGNKSAIAMMVGNALPPELIRRLGIEIARSLRRMSV